MRDANYLAAAILFLTPSISVELLTGNTSLSQYFDPITFIITNVTYGGALLLIRETVVRWNKSFASVLVLASGFGMVTEAICTKGFFDPQFYAVVSNGLEGFGRYLGINVAWGLSVSIMHAIFSVIAPFVIISTIFPGSKRWIGNRLYAVLLIALVSVCVFCFKFIALGPDYYHYNEGILPMSLIIAVIAIVIFSAWRDPDTPAFKMERPPAPCTHVHSWRRIHLCLLVFPRLGASSNRIARHLHRIPSRVLRGSPGLAANQTPGADL